MFEIIEEDGDVGLFCELYVHCESYGNPLMELGSGDEARANARELIAVLDAFVRPWTTDGSVPQHVEDVEIVLADHRIAHGHYDAQLCPRGWWVDVGDDYERIDSEQVRGWREYDRPIVRAGKVTGFMDGKQFATAPTEKA